MKRRRETPDLGIDSRALKVKSQHQIIMIGLCVCVSWSSIEIIIDTQLFCLCIQQSTKCIPECETEMPEIYLIYCIYSYFEEGGFIAVQVLYLINSCEHYQPQLLFLK